MRKKSYFSCSVSNQIIIIKNNNSQAEIINEIICDDNSNNNLSKTILSLQLTNKKLIGITEEYFHIFNFKQLNYNEEDNYKNCKLDKRIKLLEKIDDIIQVSPKFFFFFFQKTMRLYFLDI